MDPNENKPSDDAQTAITPESAAVQPSTDLNSQAEDAASQSSEQIVPSSPAPQTFKPDIQPPTHPATATPTDMADIRPATTSAPEALSGGASMPTESFSPGDSETTATSSDPSPTTQDTPQPGASVSPIVMPTSSDPSVASSAATDTPVTQSAPIVGGDSASGGNFFSRRKKVLIPTIIVVVLLLATGGVFGWYLPNRPENVWKTGLDRSGQAIEALITDGASKDQLDTVKMLDISGDMKIESKNQGNFSGTISSKIDESGSDSALTMSATADSGEKMKLGANILTSLSDKSQYPDVYFQLNGLRALGLDAFLPGISDYDGKWIILSSDYLKSLNRLDDQKSDESHATSQDATVAVLAVTKVTRDYVFTADTNKAVLVNQGYVGKETVEGVESYHYKVGFNKEHAVDYCKALGDTIASTAAFKKEVAKADQADSHKEFIKSCQDTVRDIPSDAKFDMWIGGHYKLIHMIRISDPDDQKSYVDIGQTYKGDDNLNLFLNSHEPGDKTDVNATATINTKTYSSNISLTFKNTSSDDAMTGTAHITIKPSNGHVKITPPTDAIPLQNVLQQFGIPTEPSAFNTSATTPSGTNAFSDFDVSEN